MIGAVADFRCVFGLVLPHSISDLRRFGLAHDGSCNGLILHIVFEEAVC